MSKRPTFEDDMAKLEAIVARLERNELGLEESVKAFEDGMKLAEALAKTLETAEERVQKLVKDVQGELSLASFDDEDGGEG